LARVFDRVVDEVRDDMGNLPGIDPDDVGGSVELETKFEVRDFASGVVPSAARLPQTAADTRDGRVLE
jgi:hypothetical protein